MPRIRPAASCPRLDPLLLYREPRLPGVRVDAGFAEGDEISIHYDPLLAKVIASAETRDLAISRLNAALRGYPILGIRTNIPYLLRILDHPQFQSGHVDTGFLERDGEALAEEPDPAIPPPVMAAMAAHSEAATDASATLGNHTRNGIRGVASRGGAREQRPTCRGAYRRRCLPRRMRGPERDRLCGRRARRSVGILERQGFSERHRRAHAARRPTHTASRRSRFDGADARHGAEGARGAGNAVRKGDTVIILEAMKMELPVRTSREGIVTAVHCTEGELVQPDTVLVEIADAPG